MTEECCRACGLEICADVSWCEVFLHSLKKPPIGIAPREIWEYQRFRDLMTAIMAYSDSGDMYPIEWLDELADLSLRVLKSHTSKYSSPLYKFP